MLFLCRKGIFYNALKHYEKGWSEVIGLSYLWTKMNDKMQTSELRAYLSKLLLRTYFEASSMNEKTVAPSILRCPEHYSPLDDPGKNKIRCTPRGTKVVMYQIVGIFMLNSMHNVVSLASSAERL